MLAIGSLFHKLPSGDFHLSTGGSRAQIPDKWIFASRAPRAGGNPLEISVLRRAIQFRPEIAAQSEVRRGRRKGGPIWHSFVMFVVINFGRCPLPNHRCTAGVIAAVFLARQGSRRCVVRHVSETGRREPFRGVPEAAWNKWKAFASIWVASWRARTPSNA